MLAIMQAKATITNIHKHTHTHTLKGRDKEKRGEGTKRVERLPFWGRNSGPKLLSVY